MARLSADTAVEMWPNRNQRDGDNWIEVYEDELDPNAARLRQQLRMDLEFVFESWTDCQWQTIRAACILDPRHKNLTFIDDRDRPGVYREFQLLCESFFQRMDGLSTAETESINNDRKQEDEEVAIVDFEKRPTKKRRYKRGNQANYLNSINFESGPRSDSTQSQIEREMIEICGGSVESLSAKIKKEFGVYFRAEEAKLEDDPLLWWKKNECHYSILSKMAKTYLGMFASSADVERLFSAGGNIVTELRASLKPEKVRQLLFANKNIDVYQLPWDHVRK